MKVVKIQGLRFLCETDYEIWRAATAFSKEPGTIAWLRDWARPGVVLYDVGANVGVYSLVAAQGGATVYAFEPHVGTALSLLRNVGENKLPGPIHVLTCPLGSGFRTALVEPLHYTALTPGSSGHQLGHTVGETGQPFTPVATELKLTVTLDALARTLPPPTLVKIDVDGNELAVLRGATQALGFGAVQSLQVEMHASSEAPIIEFLSKHSYAEVSRHDTAGGAKARARGVPPEQIPYNAIFQKETPHGE